MSYIRVGLIGHPVAQSKSPLIHNYWIEKHGFEGGYKAIDVPCDNLVGQICAMADLDYAGFNVTVPHKEAIVEFCDHVDDLARIAGAVNTVTVKGDELHGTNTDVFGFIQNIKSNAPDFDFAAGQAVVLGAGGAARAVVQGLIDQGAPEILLLNRTAEKAQQLLAECSKPEIVKLGIWDNRGEMLSDAHLLVNTTSLGMSGKPPLEIDLSALPANALVNDIVYAPLMTDLLKQAQVRGNPVVTGIGMLLHQARPAFEQWFGVLPDMSEELQALVLA